MNFVSYTFLFFFLPVVLLLYYATRGRTRSWILLLASYLFYAWWRLDFLFLLLFTTFLDWFCANRIFESREHSQRRLWLILSIGANLAVLGYFKYFNFGLDTINEIRGAVYSTTPLQWAKVILPIGISFYTFESMSYTIDVYRRHIEPSKSLFHYASFIGLFPHLIAGPIIRFDAIGPQLLQRTHTLEKFGRGILFFCIGFSKKTLMADNLAPLSEAFFDYGGQGFLIGWLGVFSYGMQLYFDFSGYSDMAIGLAAMFGFEFPKNFDSPYHSRSITEFWRRWHLTLSSWLKDYLYIPLGGNRLGERRTYLNLMITMLLGGLWHGASWMFVIWGGYHGALLAFERWKGKRPIFPISSEIGQRAATFLLVMVGWAFFRANDFGVFKSLFGFEGMGSLQSFAWVFRPFTVASLVLSPLIIWKAPQSWDLAQTPSGWKSLALGFLFVIAVIKMMFASYTPFLYYQF